MPSTHLLAKLKTDFPAFQFTPSHEFRWAPEEMAIHYDETANDNPTLLHELAHAILAHKEYAKDINLIELERNAWEYARTTLSPMYAVTVEEDIIQDSLDTYRDWLHARSTCPECDAIGMQTKKSSYKCIACGAQWKVNDARFCALRRYIKK